MTGRTVRDGLEDGPRDLGRLSTNANTLKNGWSVPYPRTVREQLVPRGRSATSKFTVRETSPNQIHLPQWIEPRTHTNKRRTGRTWVHAYCPRLPGGLSARCEQARDRRLRARTPAPNHLSIHGSPKRLKILKKDFGEM
jgi:hypothetical protein